LEHHEKINGHGYPSGIKGGKINHFARIVAIADIYDAMTSDRSYRDKICPFDVLKTFEHECYGELDTKYLLLFLQNIAYTYVGTWVELSNKQKAEVVFINTNHLATPIVRVDNTFYDLTLRKDLSILRLC
jgi:HD-GYP domain-containing protein (c-di-GMP phosphodiesterase class II)